MSCLFPFVAFHFTHGIISIFDFIYILSKGGSMMGHGKNGGKKFDIII